MDFEPEIFFFALAYVLGKLVYFSHATLLSEKKEVNKMNGKTVLNLRTIRRIICVVFSLSFGIATIGLANPPAYPAKPIEVVVPFAVGGGTDLMARVLAEVLSKKWGQPVNILNKPGGNTIIGTAYLMRAVPDGYTIMQDGPGSSSLQVLIPDLPYKFLERTFLARTIASGGIFVVPATSPWHTMSDVVKAAKKDPGSFTYAAYGGASSSDLQMRQFFAAAGIDVSKAKMVVFTGGGPGMNAAAGGHVQIAPGTPITALSLVNSGLIRAVGVVSPKRLKEFPNVPTMIEQGFPAVNAVQWQGFTGPPGLPAEVIRIWAQTVKEVLSDPEVVSKLEKIMAVPDYLGPDEFKKFVLEEVRLSKEFLGSK